MNSTLNMSLEQRVANLEQQTEVQRKCILNLASLVDQLTDIVRRQAGYVNDETF